MRLETRTLLLVVPLFLAALTADAQPARHGRHPAAGNRSTPAVQPAPGSLAPATRSSADGGERNAELAAIRDKLPAPSTAQQQNLQGLQDDLETIAGGAQAAEEEIRGLATDLQGMGLQAPDPALTQQLADDLHAAVDGSDLSPAEIARLTQDVYAVLASAGLSQSELAVLQADVEAILTASGVGRTEVEAVLHDLEAIAAEAQGGGSARSASGLRRQPGRGGGR